MSGNYNKKQDIRLYRYFNFTEFLFPFLGIVLVFSVPFAHFQEIFLLQVNTLMNKSWWFSGQYSLEYTLSWTWIKKLLTIDEYYTLSTFSCQSYVFRRRKSCFRYSVVFIVRSGDWIERKRVGEIQNCEGRQNEGTTVKYDAQKLGCVSIKWRHGVCKL